MQVDGRPPRSAAGSAMSVGSLAHPVGAAISVERSLFTQLLTPPLRRRISFHEYTTVQRILERCGHDHHRPAAADRRPARRRAAPATSAPSASIQALGRGHRRRAVGRRASVPGRRAGAAAPAHPRGRVLDRHRGRDRLPLRRPRGRARRRRLHHQAARRDARHVERRQRAGPHDRDHQPGRVRALLPRRCPTCRRGAAGPGGLGGAGRRYGLEFGEPPGCRTSSSATTSHRPPWARSRATDAQLGGGAGSLRGEVFRRGRPVTMAAETGTGAGVAPCRWTGRTAGAATRGWAGTTARGTFVSTAPTPATTVFARRIPRRRLRVPQEPSRNRIRLYTGGAPAAGCS